MPWYISPKQSKTLPKNVRFYCSNCNIWTLPLDYSILQIEILLFSVKRHFALWLTTFNDLFTFPNEQQNFWHIPNHNQNTGHTLYYWCDHQNRLFILLHRFGYIHQKYHARNQKQNGWYEIKWRFQTKCTRWIWLWWDKTHRMAKILNAFENFHFQRYSNRKDWLLLSNWLIPRAIGFTYSLFVQDRNSYRENVGSYLLTR